MCWESMKRGRVLRSKMCMVEDVHLKMERVVISETVNGDVRADREGVMQGLPLSNTDSSLQSKEMK
jgi:hypothetical protein